MFDEGNLQLASENPTAHQQSVNGCGGPFAMSNQDTGETQVTMAIAHRESKHRGIWILGPRADLRGRVPTGGEVELVRLLSELSHPRYLVRANPVHSRNLLQRNQILLQRLLGC